ncbi:MAG: DNA polymerase III subunit beta [Lachnospiraceae bacterium]|nr:DNA polymerase III subunit beta [Lachnospiraceae bacterium]
MKVICSKESLQRAINAVSRAVPVRTTLDILKCILLQAEDNELKLTANDTALGIETRIEAVVEEPGMTAIDAGLFSSIVRKLPDSDVLLQSDRQEAIDIRCENAYFHISGRGADDFIYLPTVQVKESIVISQFTIREMIGQVIFSAADSETSAAMSGVYLEVLQDRVRMTALDGHRIAIRVNELREIAEPVSAIVPAKTLSDLQKIVSGDLDKDIRISFARNHIIFEYDQTRMVSRVIDGEYFKVESMIRDIHETHIRINKKDLLNCLDRSTLLVNESDKKPVVMNITEEEMNLRLKSAIGTLDEMIPIEKEGKDIRIAFNPKLLLDALRVIDDEEIDIYMVKYNYPCIIRDEQGSYIYVVLPVNFIED